MKEETIEYKNDKLNVVLTVRQATVMDGMNRSVLLAKMYGDTPDIDSLSDVERLRRMLLVRTYPACLAVTSVINRGEDAILMDMTPEQFLTLPDALVMQWEDAVFRLNPHWVIRRRTSQEDDEEGEAKEPNEEKS